MCLSYVFLPIFRGSCLLLSHMFIEDSNQGHNILRHIDIGEVNLHITSIGHSHVCRPTCLRHLTLMSVTACVTWCPDLPTQSSQSRSMSLLPTTQISFAACQHPIAPRGKRNFQVATRGTIGPLGLFLLLLFTLDHPKLWRSSRRILMG